MSKERAVTPETYSKEDEILNELSVKAFDQTQLETDIIAQADVKIATNDLDTAKRNLFKKLKVINDNIKALPKDDTSKRSDLEVKKLEIASKIQALEEKYSNLQAEKKSLTKVKDIPKVTSDSGKSDAEKTLLKYQSHSNLTEDKVPAKNNLYNFLTKKASPKKKEAAFSDDNDSRRYLKRVQAYEKETKERKSGTDISTASITTHENGFRIYDDIWNSLFNYQKAGVNWLWELHCQNVGGVLGDEMGLGKTVQIIVFLAGVRLSRKPELGSPHIGLGPVLIICPATLLHQWVREFHHWNPLVRAMILHSVIGSSHMQAEQVVKDVFASSNCVLFTTYSTYLIHSDLLTIQPWHYVILDEGHKIRNPDAHVTIACKKLQTSHRLILSGTPVQNNLRELWCVFDFVYPGLLGPLIEFQTQLGVPIVQGGYATSSATQVHTAYKCACVLRDTISPYLLRRTKADVMETLNLPKKHEQVLFCQLSREQIDLYKRYLASDEVRRIFAGKLLSLPGLVTLRKICDHPALVRISEKSESAIVKTRKEKQNKLAKSGWRKLEEYADTDPEDMGADVTSLLDKDKNLLKKGRSGKLDVLDALLKVWHNQDHRCLVFCQTRQTLGIIERLVIKRGYSYLRMDGATPLASRHKMVRQFNSSDLPSNNDIRPFVFLLTTRVGGLGVNLTAAARVVIFSPDWNPCTDTQARERVYRIGQTQNVVIYRLLSAGSVEEKIYERQVFKQYLSRRVLCDPRQRRFFKLNHLRELFELDVSAEVGSDEQRAATAAMAYSSDLIESADPESRLIGLRGTKRPSAYVDGAKVKGVVKKKMHEVPSTSQSGGENVPQQDGSSSGDTARTDYVLGKLLSRGSLREAVAHDGISGEKCEPDCALVEAEATRVAQSAVTSLRRFGFKTNARSDNSISSSNGDSDTLSSASLIQAIKRRRDTSRPPVATSQSTSVVDDDGEDNVDIDPAVATLAEEIVTFLCTSKPGYRRFTASTDDLLSHFSSKLNSCADRAQMSANFRAILRSVASFSRESDPAQKGVWLLEPDFRSIIS